MVVVAAGEAHARALCAVRWRQCPCPSGEPHRVNCITMAKAKAGKRKAEPEAAEQAAAPPAEPQREVRRRVAVEKEALGPIHHDSHGQVRRTHCAAPSPVRLLALPSLPPPAHFRTTWEAELGGLPTSPAPQVAGEVFVFGDGDCGQLGLGEEVTERLRPFPVSVDGKKVGSRLPAGCWSMRTGIRRQMQHCRPAVARRR